MTTQAPEMAETPQYRHDDDTCIFLGRMPPVGDWAGDAKSVDLYCSPPAGNLKRGNVIARYGPDGDYSSGLAAVGLDPHLTEAHRRAQERGLL